MKKYKFLKDCDYITYKKDNIIEEGLIKTSGGVSIGFLEHEGYIEEIIEKPKTLKDLKKGDIIYYINTDGDICSCEYVWGELRNNDYLTKEQAERELKFRQAKRKIEDWIEENGDGKLGFTFECKSSNLYEKAIKELEQEFLFLLRDY